MPVWRTGGCPWHAVLVVQAQCRQIDSSLPVERPNLASSHTCQRPVRQRAQRSVQIRRQETRWTNHHPVAGGQMSCLGCYCGRHTRRTLHPCFKHGCWQCGRRADVLLAMLLWSTHSSHLTSTLQARLLAVWQKPPPSARKPNIQPSLRHTFSCRLLLKLSGNRPKMCNISIRTGKLPDTCH